MKNTYQIQVVRIDNGFVIAANSDDGQRAKRQAPDEKATQKELHDLVDHIFDQPPAKKKP